MNRQKARSYRESIPVSTLELAKRPRSDRLLIRTDTTLDLSQKAEKRCRNDAEAGEPPKATPTWAAARGPKVANKPAHRKRITTECTTRHFWSATWDFGSSSFKSTEWPVTPKPSVADPSVLHHRNPWLGPNETHASDQMVALARFSGIWDFPKNLLLHSSPGSFAQSDPNRCRKILWSLTADSDREKSRNFDSRWRRDAKTSAVGEAGFT
ncbi:hypothetical protein PO909_013399 [Leuciscus waleckii]